MKKTKGLTLTELLIATAIFALVLLTVYASFHAGVLGFQNIEEAIGVSQSARQIFERINLDLRNYFVYKKADDSKFTGNPNDISFLTLVDNYSKDKIRQEFAFVSYKLEGDKLMRLCRLNAEALKEESAVLPEELSSGIKEITFKYGYEPTSGSESIVFDKDSWQNNPALPLAVKVILVFKNSAKDTFERTIFLPAVE